MKLVAILALAGVIPASAATIRPKTILRTKGDLVAFAQDGSRIAVATTHGRRGCWFSIRAHDVRSGKDTILTPRRDGNTCSYGDRRWPELHFTFAGTTGLWVLSTGAHFDYQDVTTSSVRKPRDGQLAELVYDNDLYETGDHFAAAAGDGSTLVYAAYSIGVVGDPNCDLEGTCTVVVPSGGIWRVDRDGARRKRVPGAPPTAHLAVGGQTLALVVATPDTVWNGNAKSSTVQVRDPRTGALQASVTVGGAATAVALAGGDVAVLVSERKQARIDRYSAATGAFLGSTGVPASTAYELTASGNRVAFHSNRSIFVLDARTGSVRLVAVAAHPPIGLSIEGSRLAWGESLGRRGGVVRAVTVG